MTEFIHLTPVALDELSLGEIDQLEEYAQHSIDTIAKIVTSPDDPDVVAMPKGRIMRSLALMQLRRTKPDATFDDTSNVVFDVPQRASMDPEVEAEIAAGNLPLAKPPMPPPSSANASADSEPSD